MHILIVDNDASIRKALKMGIARDGWIIDDVSANSICTTDVINRYNIIIIDLDVEDICILDVIRETKHQNRKLIVMGMTRNSISEFVSEDDTKFINACYQKPLHLNMLKKAIDLELKKLMLAGTDREREKQ